jgi:hypothetical protein
MKLIQKIVFASILGAGATDMPGAETVLFEDTFDTDTAANWTVRGDSPTDTPDHAVQFAFDYGTNKYVVNGVTNTIPSAPNSQGGTTRGVRLSVNKDATAENAAVSLYPTGRQFSGNYALRADVWMNYPGTAYGEGSSGSTELSTFGINHTGTRANWHSTETVGDGIWFAMAGEGGAAQDYRAYEWDGFSVLFRRGADGGLTAEDHGDVFYQERFPEGVFESAGAPGKRWVQVEVLQRDGNIIWKVDGYVFAERPNTSPNTEGNIMIGLMDVFSSIASPAQDSFVLFDNVRVVQLDTTTPPSVTIAATDATAAEPGADTGLFTVTRTGDTSAAATVNYRVYGSAQAGSDFAILPGSVTIPAGQGSATIEVTPLNDNKAEPGETVSLSIFGSAFELRNEIAATVTLGDDNDQTGITLTLSDPWAYEGIPSDVGSVRLTRVGDTDPALSVNLTVGGTAIAGTDYQTIASPVVFPAGVTSITVNVVSIDNASASSTNRTVTIEVAAGAGYVVSNPTNFTINIREDDGAAAGTVVFSDNFDTDTSAAWTVNEAHPDSNRATFNWDYSTIGIPAAPHTTNGTTRGLKLEANIGAPTFTGLSVSPTGEGFEGDYRLSFDMWINYNGPLPAGGTGSTMSFAAGVGTGGTLPQFPGSSVEGVLFSVTGEGGSGTDWRAYIATGAPLNTNSGAYAAGMHSTVQNNSDPYYAPFGRAAATEAQLALFPEQTGVSPAGAPGMAWHEVSIERRGTNISWFVDNLRIATITLTNKEISTNIFVGFFDINATQTGNQDLSFGLVDNLRVEQLDAVQPPAEITITSITRSNANVQVIFSAPVQVQNPVVEGSAVVSGGYATQPNVQLENISGGPGNAIWRATIPMTTPSRFFRVRQP